ncbi:MULTISPECIES: GNAT family N-acetyltransferase [Thalassospira]|uniref:Acetyltransferase n=2 Tax=Thalassospira TaxID=168934 RepID=A0A367WDR0_9PROT|nr:MULTISPECIES: GNAT family N-acetyltransferase [Thalassospira]MDG4718598.1 GNAT family N-acetyltransferase [Thalassospira sp. FZY0004]RCK39586.1 acetyltransferase [Thalassospira profundimaris]
MNLSSAPLPVETNRLFLRPFVSSDFDGYATYHSLPAVYRYLYCNPLAGDALKQQFSGLLNARFTQDGDVLTLAVIRRDDDAILGEVLLKLASINASQGEVGYIFNPDFAGRGYATEAVRAIVDLGFAHFGFHRIFARLDTLNVASSAVVERLGFRREAHLIENDCFNGNWGDEYIYAQLSSEWQSKAGVSSV